MKRFIESYERILSRWKMDELTFKRDYQDENGTTIVIINDGKLTIEGKPTKKTVKKIELDTSLPLKLEVKKRLNMRGLELKQIDRVLKLRNHDSEDLAHYGLDTKALKRRPKKS
jgi:predicted rRNA methylase YqxC with S4 and FtsJ domains